MEKKTLTVAVAAVMVMAMSITAFASGWQQEEDGRWWYGTNDDNSTWYAGEWQWIGGNCYYFYDDGYMAADTSVDGYTVNADGAWTVDGAVQVQDTASETGNETVTAAAPVLDGMYNDWFWVGDFHIYTDAEGTLHVEQIGDDGEILSSVSPMKYNGDNTWGSYEMDAHNGILPAHASLNDNGTISMTWGFYNYTMTKQ